MPLLLMCYISSSLLGSAIYHTTDTVYKLPAYLTQIQTKRWQFKDTGFLSLVRYSESFFL